MHESSPENTRGDHTTPSAATLTTVTAWPVRRSWFTIKLTALFSIFETFSVLICFCNVVQAKKKHKKFIFHLTWFCTRYRGIYLTRGASRCEANRQRLFCPENKYTQNPLIFKIHFIRWGFAQRIGVYCRFLKRQRAKQVDYVWPGMRKKSQ